RTTPSAAAMGSAAGGAATTSAQAEQTARTLAAAGINLNFAPVVDLNSNSENPIIGKIGRSFAQEPDQVIQHAWAWICAHKGQGIVSCLKHFPGHGSSTTDSHLGFVDISASWQENELTPYRELIKRGAIEMIMAGHLFNRHLDSVYPAPLSRATITGLLRQDLGFTGVVLTDDIQMKGITDRYALSEILCRSFAAGIDMIVIGNNLAYDAAVLDTALTAVLAGLRQGIVSEERLCSALGRVAKLKQSMKGK
ncbi:MAG: glycoside hydrolase family 3 protein, partial [Desulfofustis sp.]|nr:glycoside hydrolase family 3 protein [Desulfofustis sp.]